MEEQRHNSPGMLLKCICTQTFSEKMLLSSVTFVVLSSSQTLLNSILFPFHCFLLLGLPFLLLPLNPCATTTCNHTQCLWPVFCETQINSCHKLCVRTMLTLLGLCNEEMHRIYTMWPLSIMFHRLICICFQQLMDTCMEIYPISPCVQRTGSSGILLAWVTYSIYTPSISMDKLCYLEITGRTPLQSSLLHWKMPSWWQRALESGYWTVQYMVWISFFYIVQGQRNSKVTTHY